MQSRLKIPHCSVDKKKKIKSRWPLLAIFLVLIKDKVRDGNMVLCDRVLEVIFMSIIMNWHDIFDIFKNFSFIIEHRWWYKTAGSCLIKLLRLRVTLIIHLPSN